jgi:uncharacterized protein (TIGR02246 family)
MRQSLYAALAILALVLATTSSVSGRQGDARAAIEAANKQFVAAFAKGDAAALAAMYTTGALAFPPNGEVTKGREAIQKLWKGVIDAGIKAATLTTTEVETHGDTAHEVGNYEMKVEGGKVADRGKYIVIWKRDGGQWKLHRDIWNSSMPAGK